MADSKTIGLDQVRTVSEKTDDVLARISDNSRGRMENAVRSLESKMSVQLRKIQANSNGRIEGLKVNLKQTQAIHKKMLVEFEKTYGAAAAAAVSDFDQISDLIENSWTYLGESANYTSVDKNMIRSLKTSTLRQFEQFGSEAQSKITSAMYSHVAGGGSYAGLLNTITGALSGHRDIRGRSMAMYANQYAFDSVMNFHNQVNLSKANDLGIYHFLYVGDIMGTSRQFCRRRAGKVYTRGQINSWDRHQWDGKAGPAFVYRGGYNCRHHWRPVRPEWLDGKTQLDIGDWNVGEDIGAKPKFLMGGSGVRGWNDYTKPERTMLSNLHRFVKGGKKELSTKQKWYRFWSKGMTQAERDAYVLALEEEGLDVPSILKKKGAGPGPIPPKVAPVKPVVKPPPITPPKPPSTPPSPPSPVPGARTWGQLTPEEKKLATGLRRTIIKNPDKIKATIPRVKKWNEIPAADRAMIVQRWEKEGIDVPAVLRKGNTLPVAPTVIEPVVPTPPPIPKPVLDVISGGKSASALSIQVNKLEAISKDFNQPWSVRSEAREKLSGARVEYSKVCSTAELNRLRKKVLTEMMNKKPTPRALNAFNRGLSHVPFSVIQEMQDSGLDILLDDYYYGAFFNNQRRVVKLGKMFYDADTVAHEFAHAIDSRMANGAVSGFSRNMGSWRSSNPFPAGKVDTKNYRSWYNNQHSGSIGNAMNGNTPYKYHIGNFIDKYEGRIYNHGFADEFFSMGSERYSNTFIKTKNRIQKTYNSASSSVLNEFEKTYNSYTESQFSLGVLRREINEQIRAAKTIVGEMDGETFISKGFQNPHGTQWGKQRKYYPEYADWMEDFYATMRKQERPLTVNDMLKRKSGSVDKEKMEVLRKIASYEEIQ